MNTFSHIFKKLTTKIYFSGIVFIVFIVVTAINFSTFVLIFLPPDLFSSLQTITFISSISSFYFLPLITACLCLSFPLSTPLSIFSSCLLSSLSSSLSPTRLVVWRLWFLQPEWYLLHRWTQHQEAQRHQVAPLQRPQLLPALHLHDGTTLWLLTTQPQPSDPPASWWYSPTVPTLPKCLFIYVEVLTTPHSYSPTHCLYSKTPTTFLQSSTIT